MFIRTLKSSDLNTMWQINEQGLPGVGQVDETQISDLITLSNLAIGVEDTGVLAGFVLCLPPGTRYGSLNYAWFNERYDRFLYVDRIAVAESHRNRGVGTLLYRCVIDRANSGCAGGGRVSLKPLTLARCGFITVSGLKMSVFWTMQTNPSPCCGDLLNKLDTPW